MFPSCSRCYRPSHTARDAVESPILRGRNRIHVDTESDAEITRRQSEMQWVVRINEALKEDQFALFRQAIATLSNARLRSHSEVLLRLCQCDGTFYSPRGLCSGGGAL